MNDQDNEKRLTKKFLKKLLSSDFRFYYTTPYLNDSLYLHYKGFPKIENLEEFTGLKVLYLEGNGLGKIEGLQECRELKSLYLQENLIKKIENLESQTDLHNLNLTDNCIQTIENLACCPKLGTLQIKRNQIGLNGIKDLEHLTQLQSLTVLDISDNRIEDENMVDEVLAKMEKLAVLYLSGNEVTKKVKNYRKTLIIKLKNLKYLDDRPVFPEERRFCEAFDRGGIDAEREERKLYKKEQEEAHLRNHYAFRDMIEKYRKEAEAEKQQNQVPQGENPLPAGEASVQQESDQIPQNITEIPQDMSQIPSLESPNDPSNPNDSSLNSQNHSRSNQGESLLTYNSQSLENKEDSNRVRTNSQSSSKSLDQHSKILPESQSEGDSNRMRAGSESSSKSVNQNSRILPESQSEDNHNESQSEDENSSSTNGKAKELENIKTLEITQFDELE